MVPAPDQEERRTLRSILRSRRIAVMIDTHCHLTDPRLGSQLPLVLERAAAAGISRMITIGTGPEDSIACVALCRDLPNVRCTAGVHPSYVDEVDEGELPAIEETAGDPSVLAIGEVGLDYFRGRDNRDRQIRFFRFQLRLAVKMNKPLVIHCREAVDDCLAVLADFPQLKMVFHCFTGTVSEAQRILDRGFLLGFTGPITYKKSDELREVVKLTPIDRLLVETDAPYLTPEPMRKQKINEPALVAHVAAKVAELKQMTVEQVDQITTANVKRLFGW